jgi:hypothetical protein
MLVGQRLSMPSKRTIVRKLRNTSPKSYSYRYHAGELKGEPKKVNPKHYRALNHKEKRVSRGPYFKIMKRERSILRRLERVNSLPFDKVGVCRRQLRLAYYCMFPILFLFLWYPPDRELLLELEETYYNWLNTVNLVREKPVRVNRLRCGFWQQPIGGWNTPPEDPSGEHRTSVPYSL